MTSAAYLDSYGLLFHREDLSKSGNSHPTIIIWLQLVIALACMKQPTKENPTSEKEKKINLMRHFI